MKKAIFGGLIEFESQEKLKEFIENIDSQMSVKIIEGAMEYGLKSGLFNLEEAYCMYNCLNVIKNCANSHGTGFKGPSRFPEVELDEKPENESTD